MKCRKASRSSACPGWCSWFSDGLELTTSHDRYFRQLQELSDSVRDVEWEGPLTDAVNKTHEDEELFEREIIKLQARQRYLKNLAENEDEDEEEDSDEEDEVCFQRPSSR